jgi:hypothetical protein
MTTPLHLRADDTQPRNRLIAFYTALVVFTLLLLKPLFDSYFESMYSAETSVKVLTQPAVELETIRARERVLLEERGVPLDRVFSQLARGRQASPAIIAPQPSTAVDAIKGWQFLPAFVHTADRNAVDPAAAAAAATPTPADPAAAPAGPNAAPVDPNAPPADPAAAPSAAAPAAPAPAAAPAAAPH